MPYKDLKKQKKAQQKSYRNNKQIYKERNQKRRTELKKWFATEILFGKVCTKCGEDDTCCLDFHHIDPSTKIDGIAELLNHMRSKQRIITEIEKCIILCANCHRKLHNKMRKLHKEFSINRNDPVKGKGKGAPIFLVQQNGLSERI